MSTEDATKGVIEDHDVVRVRKDLGSFVVRAKISPSVRPEAVPHLGRDRSYETQRAVGELLLGPPSARRRSMASRIDFTSA